MGYHVHILRTKSAQVLPITKDEVRQAVIPMRGRLSVMPDKPELWLYQPALSEESEIVAFDDNDGSLWTASPSDPLLSLMIELAGKLNARVRGDELETYLSLEETYVHPDDQVLHEANRPKQQAWTLSPVMREMTLRVAGVIAGIIVLTSVLYLYRYFTRA
jgi:hypothetical protein